MEKLAYADEKVLLWINSLAGRFSPLDRVVEWVVSDYLIPVSLALALVGLWFAGVDKQTRQRNQIGMFVALSSMAISNLAVFVINIFYFRPRPFVDHDLTRALLTLPQTPPFPPTPSRPSSVSPSPCGSSTGGGAPYSFSGQGSMASPGSMPESTTR